KDGSCVDNAKICGDAVCTDTQTCKDGGYIDNAKICGDAICTDTQTCKDGSCVDTSRVCSNQVCPEGQVCLNDDCVPGDSICGGILSCDPATEECVDNNHCEPIDPCRNVTCTVDGQICDDGNCRNRKPCENIQCNDGQTCAVTSLSPLGECIDTKCAVDEDGKDYKVEKKCDENQMCVDGTCVDDGCIDKTCDTGWICIKGNCEEEACIGKVCDDGRSCVAGNCIDDECLPLADHPCDEGMTCSKGTCVYDKCVGVVCPQDKVCIEDGTCQFNSDLAIVSGRIEDPTTDEHGKTASFEVSLNHIPAQNVTFTCEIVPPESADEAEVDCTNIVITPDNWSDPHYINVTGLADHIVDGDQEYAVKMTSHSDDPEFDGLTFQTDKLSNIDVDKAAINAVNADNLVTSEAGTTAEFSLSFASRPSQPVTLTLSSSDTTEGVITSVGGNAGNTVTVQPEDWDKPIVVVVTGVDDKEHDGEVVFDVTFAVQSDDANYSSVVIDPVSIKNMDDDSPSATFSKTEIVTDETPSSASFSFYLTTAPKANVKATLKITKNEDEIVLDATEVTIGKSAWNQENSVKVTGVADHIIDPDEPFEITVTFTSDDPDYNFVRTVTGTNRNTDIAAFTLPASSSTNVTEAGSSVNFEVRLSSKPTADVVVTVSTDDATETKVSPALLTFTPSDWDKSQTVTVTGVDDHLVDGPQVSKISLKVSDTADDNFKSLALEAWTVTTEDDDKAGLVVSKSNLTVNENGGKDTFTVALAAQPESKTVTVGVTSNNTGALTVSPTSLTFTLSDWNKPQTVTVTGVDNKIADLNGQRNATVSLSSTSDDTIFAGLKGSVAATIMDDDTPVVDLNVTNALLTPSAPSTTLSVSLSMEPASDVTVSLVSSSSILGFSKNSVSFTPSNWNTPQTVTVTTNGSLASNAWTYANITGTASSSNAYNGKSDKVNVTYKAFESVTGNTKASGAVTSCSQSVTLLPGRYKLQVWGASGGDDVNNNQSLSSHGGLGGYAEGILTLTAKTTAYLHFGTVGYKGVYGKVGASAIGQGCNGGGGATCLESNHAACGFGGGGASDIRIGGDTLYHRVIVAGGGGGSDDHSTGSDECVNCWNDGTAGAGGGTEGIRGKQNGVANVIVAGTQTSGNAFGVGGAPGINQDLGGGGGGWYGGIAPQTVSNAGGGGGSGFVYTSASTGLPSGFALAASMQLAETKIYNGTQSFPAVTSGSETGHQGNGYARITLLE
ncbi:MAG: hypothetical protein IJU23_01985, partial [Proteobacteria bacterium]|nr:hypothetical protein [Pseudomonadota bacterium]